MTGCHEFNRSFSFHNIFSTSSYVPHTFAFPFSQKRRVLGKSSREKDGPLSIGAMEKEEQTGGRSITTDLENENVMRTKRASGFRSVLFQRSTWAVFPVSRAHGGLLL